jgi:dTDP-4-amino-4,6-dideoxygalactose transaminase
MDGIQAAVLSVKLKHLDRWNEARRRHAERYHESLAKLDRVRLIETAPTSEPVFHLLVARVSGREDVMARLHGRGIGCAIHYPVPVHQTEAYSDVGLDREGFAVSERLAEEVLSLPMFAEMTESDLENTLRALEESVRI